MRRLVAIAAGALGLLVLPVAPASAAFNHAAWTSPPGVTPPSGGSDDWTATVDDRETPQQITLGGVFDHPDGVANVTLALERSEYPDREPPCAPTGFGQTAPGSTSGPTAFSFDVLVPCNGLYLVRANATSRGSVSRSAETTAIRLALTVVAPPVPASALQATAVDGGEPQVKLTWEPVPPADRDPDFEGYDIERSVDGGAFELIASLPDPDSASYIDKRPEPGTKNRYRIVSLRRAGADPNDGVVAAGSGNPEAEVDVASPADEETTGPTTTDDDGAGDERAGGSSPTTARTTRTVRRAPGAPPRRTVTTIDTGFGETLPFEPGEEALPADDVPPPGDSAVVAQIEDGDDESTAKQTLALIAGGSAMAVGAFALRRVLRQAASPYEILQ